MRWLVGCETPAGIVCVPVDADDVAGACRAARQTLRDQNGLEDDQIRVGDPVLEDELLAGTPRGGDMSWCR